MQAAQARHGSGCSRSQAPDLQRLPAGQQPGRRRTWPSMQEKSRQLAESLHMAMLGELLLLLLCVLKSCGQQ